MKTVQLLSQLFIPVFIFGVILYGAVKRVRVYDSFVGGAKEGVRVAARIFPYLLAIFVAIKSFQASGAFDFAKEVLGVGLGAEVELFGYHDFTEFPPESAPDA